MSNDQALRGYVRGLVALHEQKADIAAEIKDLKDKAKGDGFTPKALMVLVKREMETADQKAKRLEIADEVERMEVALGMFAETPLGSAAISRIAAE